MKISEIKIENLKQSLDMVKQFKAMSYVFRGVSDSAYPLETTYDRCFAKSRGKEAYLLNEFKRKIHHFLEPNQMPESIFELLALMQHFGGPTRLLDFTKSYFIALYFACRDAKKKDGIVYAVMMTNLLGIGLQDLQNRKFPLPIEMEGLLPDHIFPTSFRSDKYFKEAILSDNYSFILALEPYKLNDRISKQQGLFLINSSSMFPFHQTLSRMLDKSNKELDENAEDITMIKIIIPATIKNEIMAELFEMNITAETLFGGLDGFSRSLRDKADSIYQSDFDSKFTPTWYKDL